MARILAADDDVASAVLIGDLLRLWGHEALVVGNGAEALACLENGGIELVLLDLQMPVLDGWSTLGELRRRPHLSNLPVIAVSAFAATSDRDRALALGFDAFVGKPIPFEGLRRQIDELLAAERRPEPK